jgi:hypothetical protein
MMVHFRKGLSGNILKEVNALIIEKYKKEDEKRHGATDHKGGDSGVKNKGTLIVDATCAPEDMRFPHEVTLLDEARRKTEVIIDILHAHGPEGIEKPRTYRKRARKEFLAFLRNRKPREGTIRKALKTQIQHVERNLRIISEYRDKIEFEVLSRKQYRELIVISEIVRQQRVLYRREGWSIEGRILSIAKPHVLTRSIGHERICGTVRNRGYGIRLSGPKLGRPFKAIEKNKKRIREFKRIERDDERTRIAVEGKFGEAKQRYTLDRIGTKLKATSETSIMMVFLVMNLMVVAKGARRKPFLRCLLMLLY